MRRGIGNFFGWLAMLGVGLFAVAPAEAQDPCAENQTHSRVIEVRYKPLSQAAQLVDEMLGPCGAYKVSKALGAVIVEDDSPRLERIAEAVSAWDVPPRAVDVTVTLMMASRDLPPVSGIAEELKDISRTISDMTRWTRFNPLGTVNVRVREGGEAQVEIADRYRVVMKIKGVDAKRRAVRIEPFELDRLPVPASSTGSSLVPPPRKLWGGELDLTEGPQHLVGATARGRRRAIFLVFTVRIVGEDEPAPAANLPGER